MPAHRPSRQWRVALLVSCFAAALPARAQTFQLSYPAGANAGPITGRAFLFVARTDKEEPRLQSGPDRGSEPFFGVDVEVLAAGKAVTIDPTVLGFPVASLKQLPAGDYFVQGMILPYTQFRRSDGHTIWAHMDAGEGQRFNRSPGSLISEVRKVHIDPAKRTTVSLSLANVIPQIAAQTETEWVKRVHMTSKLASAFWGHPMPLGAVVLLPKGYAENTTKRYPVVYTVGHYSERPPLGFRLLGCD